MSKQLIIDTNLLLLLVIGAVEEGRHIHNSKRLNALSIDDYNIVLKIMSKYEDVYITPYIATEVSNLIDLNGYARLLAYGVAKQLFSIFKKIDIDVDCKPELFLKFGITDSSIIGLSKDYYILTNDHRMLIPLFKIGKENIIPYMPYKQLK